MKKPQDISEPMVLDISDWMNSVILTAVMLDAGISYEVEKLLCFEEDGFKRSISISRWEVDGITDLSAKKTLRLSKVSECVDKYIREIW